MIDRLFSNIVRTVLGVSDMQDSQLPNAQVEKYANTFTALAPLPIHSEFQLVFQFPFSSVLIEGRVQI